MPEVGEGMKIDRESLRMGVLEYGKTFAEVMKATKSGEYHKEDELKRIQEANIEASEKRALGVFVEDYTALREKNDQLWNQYQDEDRANKMYKDRTGQLPAGHVDIVRTDVTVHFVCHNKSDYNILITTAGGKLTETGRVHLSEDLGVALGEVGFKDHGRTAATVEYVNPNVRDSGEDIKAHERRHIINRLLEKQGLLGQKGLRENTPYSKFTDNLIKLPSSKQNEYAAFSLQWEAGQTLLGYYDRDLVNEIMALADGKEYQSDEMVVQLGHPDYNNLFFIEEAYFNYCDKTELDKMKGVHKTFVKFQKFLNEKRQGVRESAVKALFETKEALSGDMEIAMGVMSRFTLDKWPAVGRLILHNKPNQSVH